MPITAAENITDTPHRLSEGLTGLSHFILVEISSQKQNKRVCCLLCCSCVGGPVSYFLRVYPSYRKYITLGNTLKNQRWTRHAANRERERERENDRTMDGWMDGWMQ